MEMTIDLMTGLVFGFELIAAEDEDEDNMLVLHLCLLRVVVYY